MLDVVHVLFEEDTLPRWEHDAEMKSKVREQVYESMYGVRYKYGTSSNRGRSANWDEDSESIYTQPDDGSIKPYIPPSEEDELYDILGAPMGE